MLTLDDLDHFNNTGMAHLFASANRRVNTDSTARVARILACLNFCRDIPDTELVVGGMQAARRAIRAAVRRQQRQRRLDPSELLAALASVQAALGDHRSTEDEPPAAGPERHAVEAEIQDSALKLAGHETADGRLLTALITGEFEILPASNLAPLSAVIGKFSGTASIDLELAVDGEGATQMLCLHLVVAAGFWRWSAQEGCCMSRNGAPAVALAPDDAVVQAVLAGLALRSGRTIAGWLEAIRHHRQMSEAQSA